MGSSDDITLWIKSLNAGDQQAAEALWKTFFERLARVARRQIDRGQARHTDEEDVALSAMQSFYRGAQAGLYPQLAGRDELWRLLLTIVNHKLSGQRRKDRAQKRGGGQNRGESAFFTPDSEDFRGIEQVLGEEPTPELAATLSETCQRLMAGLEDESLRKVAQDKLEGYTNDEIAARLGCTTRSVERKLNRIRSRCRDLGLE
jgi:DNA-directed RNA polymerase specialized sigma24 family protein